MNPPSHLKYAFSSNFNVHSGVDEFASITLKYSGERVAQLSCSIGVDLTNDAVVYGTKGKLKLQSPFWFPTKLETAEVSVTCAV